VEEDVVTHLVLQSAQVDIVQAANLVAPEVGSAALAFPADPNAWPAQSLPVSTGSATVPLSGDSLLKR